MTSRGYTKIIDDIWDDRLGTASHQIIPSTYTGLGSFLDAPSTPFPSLIAGNKGKTEVEIVSTDKIKESTSGQSQPQKAVQVKRPIGRPRIHPKKFVDPNRIKRGKD